MRKYHDGYLVRWVVYQISKKQDIVGVEIGEVYSSGGQF